MYFDDLKALSEIDLRGTDESQPVKKIGDLHRKNGIRAEVFQPSQSTYLLGLRTTKQCLEARKISSIQFIYATKDAVVCDQLDRSYRRSEFDTQQPSHGDILCTDAMMEDLTKQPSIVTFVDRRMTATEEKFYTVMGVFALIVIFLIICLVATRKKLHAALRRG